MFTFKVQARTHTYTHSNFDSAVSLRGIHQSRLGFAASGLEGPQQIPDIEIDSSTIDCTLHQLYICRSSFAIVSHFLTHFSALAYSRASPPQKQTVPTVSSGKKEKAKKNESRGKIGMIPISVG